MSKRDWTKCKRWKTSDGSLLLPHEIETDHLKNILVLIKRRWSAYCTELALAADIGAGQMSGDMAQASLTGEANYYYDLADGPPDWPIYWDLRDELHSRKKHDHL